MVNAAELMLATCERSVRRLQDYRGAALTPLSEEFADNPVYNEQLPQQQGGACKQTFEMRRMKATSRNLPCKYAGSQAVVACVAETAGSSSSCPCQ